MPKLYYKVKVNGKWTFRSAEMKRHPQGWLVEPWRGEE